MTALEELSKDLADALVGALEKHSSPDGTLPTAEALKATVAAAYTIQIGLLKDHSKADQQLLIMELMLPAYLGLLHNLKERFL